MSEQNSSNLKVFTIPVGTIQQNCRIFLNEDTKQAFIVDPGANAQELANFIQELGCQIEAIIVTHGHFDHIGGISELRRLLPKQVPVIGPFVQDEPFFSQVQRRCAEFGLPDQVEDFVPQPELGDRFFAENEVLNLIGLEFQVLFTPGHSPGHGVLVNHANRFVIAGDVLFRDGVGRTDLPGGSFEALKDAIQQKLYTLDTTNGDYLVYTGHGATTTINYEREHNPFVSAN
ncbi:MBL fold metallo-hydrolase [Psittacicella hinzii]|uniref:Metallo-beta-lactamase domain-containing protein n=1 Tax=Psittacicella hinzii TaxID=2028575 RepID=A0A3A1YNG7_9GAMM|nr:MBL fold metallo-hydrolase [Psittacicella hinzii]RIY38778.1 hypothetical protein CKF58_03440 [Psittacicella hinzii]